ncbi:MAG TPA: adenylate/guanylate cyclase domain-containing protein, partial [Candidatus Eisenbacteria bacterium]|nr:adenylate/guanylate cyclase domain-containing protein [Candidatus Eisenbacteria bacterium]
FEEFSEAAAAIPQTEYDDLYKIAGDELQDVLVNPMQPFKPGNGALLQRPFRKGEPGAKKQSAGPGNIPLVAIFFRFLDAKGQVLPTTDGRAGLLARALNAKRAEQAKGLDPRRKDQQKGFDPKRADASKGVDPKRLEQQLASVSKAVNTMTLQQVGYLAPEINVGKSQLLEVVVTPVIDTVKEKTMGALVIGFPVPEMGEQLLNDMSAIRTGIWVDGQIYSKSIPERYHEQLAARIAEGLKKAKPGQDELQVEVEGMPYQLFFKALNEGSDLPAAYQVGLYSLEKANRDQQDLRVSIIGFSSLAVLGAFALSLLLSHGLAVPLRELVTGTEEIKQGNFHIKVPVRSGDEIGQLAASFNEMATGLELKEKYRSVLNKVTDKDVAEQLMSGKLSLGGEIREVTVMFCDIRGFTPLSQNKDPAEVIHMLNEHMTALEKVISEHNGVVDKYIGDAIMAIFGAPKSYGADAYNASRCALRMIQERQKLNETSQYKIQIGIGLATGPVLAGNMGSDDRLNYTVIGENVNLASRLCTQAGRMEVVIGQATREKLADAAEVIDLPELRLKGFTDAVRAFKLTTIHAQQPKTNT